MSKVKMYLDTSVPSAYFDISKPLRQHVTEKWFEFESENFELFTSIITIRELMNWKNETKRHKVIDLLDKHKVTMLPITPEILALGNEYIAQGAIPASESEDALHIASAAINQIESLVSWNFKHIVSVNPIRKIHQINLQRSLPLIEIGTIEIFGGYKYGSL